MNDALQGATQAARLASPNPAVGCLITTPDGRVLGQGHTQRTGGPHAEVMALRDAATQGHSVKGATAYVTLEPCSHHGRTPPCCDALIDAGLAHVVVALQDPNPLVAGQGIARLRASGITVTVLDPQDPAAVAARELNIGFFSRMIRNTPWVRMKVAASVDGHTALPNGASQWITSEPARIDGHAWRARASAVLSGIGTVLQDDPLLDVRHVATERQPHLVIVDSQLETPLNARLFSVQGRRIFIYAAAPNEAKKSALEALGATVVHLPDANGKVDLALMLQDLAQREINELHVEAGFKLNGSLLRGGLVDELVIYLAPKLLGSGLGLAHIGPFTELSQAQALTFKSVEMLGPDLRIVARIPGRDAF
jgi:diaminohydroxyphosphoribosylaminopyrimidine deaminase / 5-amino-6-(5-phosphoribosylamino)uracil reductase